MMYVGMLMIMIKADSLFNNDQTKCLQATV